MNEQIAKIVQNRWFEPSVVALGGVSVGFAAGYILGRRRGQAEVLAWNDQAAEDLAPKIDLNVDQLERLREVINSNKELDAVREELAEKPTRVVIPEEEAESILEHPLPANGAEAEPNPPLEVQERIDAFNRDAEAAIAPIVEPDVVSQSVFAQDSDDWDYEKELKNRNTGEPYIIHKDEFYTEESGYSQTTLTYYAGDNIMVDQEDKPLYNYETVTGPLRFGHGSEDPNVVYVRNDRRMAEYEILLDRGSYAIEVLGLEAEEEQVRELRHSIPKFRLVE